MKKITFILVLLIALTSCKTENTKIDTTSEINTDIETPFVSLNEFDTKAGEFVNKQIKVNGIVDHVCKHGGKKILLVTDESDVHVVSDERFDETLKGSEIILTGVVLEEIIDESYCLKMEEDNIKSHSEGTSNEEQFEAKKQHIQQYRDKMKAENIAYISNYSLKYVSHTEIQ